VVVGVGTRWSDFTTASRSAFAADGVRFVNVNIAAFDAAKHAGVAVVADARTTLDALREALSGWGTEPGYRQRAGDLAAEWDETVARAYHAGNTPLPAQSEVLGAVNDVSQPRDVVVCAAGSIPGDLHKLWRTRDPKGYHVEYGYSCMGYEIAGGLGVKLAAPDREVFVLVGDGSYLMMAQELVTAVQEGVKLIVVIVQNHGFASIGRLSESVGVQRFGTAHRYRGPGGRLDGDVVPVDLAANAASLGADVLRAGTVEELRAALVTARAARRTTVVHIEVDPTLDAPASESWWDVPVAEVSTVDSTAAARAAYEKARLARRRYL
jgi:3D-(3,5/4)-trihydroxycyclohexane-1,2-dione acylhydrolase (decyclizing)